MTPTPYLRFIKRRVGRNVVRILQQKWEDLLREEWRDVEMADDAPQPTLPVIKTKGP